MALVLKAKTKTVGPVVDKSTTPDDVVALIDLIGGMQADAQKALDKIKELQKSLKPYKDAMAKLTEIVTNDARFGDDETFQQNGVEFVAEIGKKGSSRRIADMAGIRKMMGDETFMKCVTMTLANVDAYLTQMQRDQVLKTDRVERSVTLVRKVAKKKAA